jgi:NitT/TauT family transport system substrate-binding protein
MTDGVQDEASGNANFTTQPALVRFGGGIFCPRHAGIGRGRARDQGAPRKVTLAWMPTALCHIAVSVADKRGFFAKHNLDVEFVNWAGSTDLLLEAISTGKADAGVGMILRWLKPMEQGFDVKLTAGTHGGCMHVLAAPDSGLKSLADLRGKRLGVGDISSVDKNFFSIVLQKKGIDPVSDVEWKQFPADMLGVALKKVGSTHSARAIRWPSF